MSQENVKIVRRSLEAAAVAGMRVDGLDDQAIDRVVQVFHPEVEFREDPKFPDGSVYHGRDALHAPTSSGSAASSIASGGRRRTFWARATTRFSYSFGCAVAVKAAARSSTFEEDGFSRWARERLSEWMRRSTGGEALEAAGLSE